MTISNLAAQVKNHLHTELERSTLLYWLNSIESTIYNEIVLTHENPNEITFTGFDDTTDGDTSLIAPDMFSDLYLHYISMKTDILTGETERQNNSTFLFSAAYQSFADWYNRTHMPMQSVTRYKY